MKKPQAGTYQDKALTYLKTGHSLDLPKALALFGICRLSAAILELRKKGFDVRTHKVKTTEGNEFSFYTLPKAIDQDTRIGTRVVVKAGSEGKGVVKEWLGLTGRIEEMDNDDEYLTCRVRLDDARIVWFAIDELTPEYLHAK